MASRSKLSAAASIIVLSIGLTHAQVRIGLIGDQTYSDDLDESYRILAKGVSAFRDRRIAYNAFLHLGDLLESSSSPEQVRRDFERAVAALDRLPSAWYLTPGDHDVNPPGFTPDSSDRSRELLFQELYSAHQPRIGERLYYSFNLAGYHFVALYSLERLHSDPRWGNVFLSGLSDEQFQWLERDLADNPNVGGVVVFTHHPLWYNWGGWERVHRLLSRHQALAVISGHFHYPQIDAFLDGIQYLTVGASGARIKQASPRAGGVQAVYTLLLEGKNARFEIHPLEGEDLAEIPSRSEMDRVQAVDTILDVLEAAPPVQPIYWRQGHLVASCERDRPAQLVLQQFGNPIDVGLETRIEPVSDWVRIESASFSEGLCLNGAEADSCHLRPGVNIALSNSYVVQLGQIASQPVWQATLKVGGEVRPVPERLLLTIRCRFLDPLGQPLDLWRTLQIPINQCPAR